MDQDNDSNDEKSRAEEFFRQRFFDGEDISQLSPEEIRRLVQQLRIHQIELEIQNEELRRAQRELEESRDEYIALYESVPAGCLTLSDRGIVLAANVSAAKLLGVERGNLLKTPLSRFLSQNDADTLHLHIRKALETGEKQTEEISVAGSDGTLFYAQLQSVPIRGDDGRFSLCRTIIVDISERKRAEALLRESEERLSLAVEGANLGLWDWNLKTGRGILNERAASMLGYSIGDFETDIRTLKSWIHPDDWPDYSKALNGHLEGRLPFLEAESRLRCASGEWKWILSRGKITAYDSDGKPLRMTGTTLDVTDRKHTEIALRESEARFRSIFDNAPIMINGFSPNGEILFWNPELEKQGGWSLEEARTGDVFALAYPDADKYREVKETIARADGVFREYTPRARDGSLHTQLWANFPLPNDNIISVGIDITGQRLSEEKLIERLLVHRDLIEKASAGFCVCHNISEKPYVRFTQWNPLMKQITGYTMEEMNEFGWYQTMYPDPAVRARAVERMARMRVGGDLHGEEWVLTTKDGSKRPVSISTSVITEEGGETHVLAIMQDIAERKRLEEDLQESEERLELALRGADLGLWDYNLQTGEAFVNQRRAEMVGYTLDETEAHVSFWGRLVHPDDIVPLVTAFNAHANGERPFYECEHRLRRKSGEYIWVLARGEIVERDAAGAPVRMVGTTLDITKRKRVENDLQASEALYRALVETTGTGYVVIDPQGRVLDANPEYVRMTGHGDLDDIRGRSVVEWTAEHDKQRNALEVEKCFATGSVRNLEIDYVDKNGNIVPVEINATVIDKNGSLRVITLCREIRERKQMENEIKASLQEKEVMLREIHHRVKNNLQVICSLLDIQSKYVKDDSLKPIVNDSERRVRSMALVHEKLYQSRNLASVGIRDYMDSLVSHLLSAFAETAKSVTLSTDVADVDFVPDTVVPLGLAITELLSNSLRHAFPEGKGELTISLHAIKQGEFELVIKDNGIGMPENIEVGKTNTFGLSLVHTLAKQLKGSFRIDGGRGTVCRLRFPVMK